MNSKQMKKWLEQQGASFLQGKGSHLKVFLNGKIFVVDARALLSMPSAPKPNQKTMRPSALECAKLGLYQAMTEQGI